MSDILDKFSANVPVTRQVVAAKLVHHLQEMSINVPFIFSGVYVFLDILKHIEHHRHTL